MTAAQELYESNEIPFAGQFGIHVQDDPTDLGRQLLHDGVVELIPDPSMPDANFLNGLYRFRELEDVPTAGSSNVQVFKVCCSVRMSLCGEADHTPLTYEVARAQTLALMCSALTKRGITNERISRWQASTDHSWNCLIRF